MSGATAGRRLLPLLLLALLAACQSSPRQQPADTATAQREGERAYAAGEWREAEPHYRTLVDAIPQDAELWFRLGNIYARTDRPDQAVRAYREALVRDRDLAKAWFNMGVVHLRQAANSFLKLEVHASGGDTMALQGREAYDAIMAILGEQTAAAPPAAAAPRDAAGDR